MKFEAEPGVTAIGDMTLLRILLRNLLQNAWKYTQSRHDARIEVGVVEGEGDLPIFHVRDNGIGFDNANNYPLPTNEMYLCDGVEEPDNQTQPAKQKWHAAYQRNQAVSAAPRDDWVWELYAAHYVRDFAQYIKNDGELSAAELANVPE